MRHLGLAICMRPTGSIFAPAQSEWYAATVGIIVRCLFYTLYIYWGTCLAAGCKKINGAICNTGWVSVCVRICHPTGWRNSRQNASADKWLGIIGAVRRHKQVQLRFVPVWIQHKNQSEGELFTDSQSYTFSELRNKHEKDFHGEAAKVIRKCGW